MKKQQSGFTLIELIMVIVILGILSAVALPKFADISSNAKAAVIEGALGSAKSAAVISHSAFLAAGGSSTSVSLDGTAYTLVNAYPDNADICAVAGLDTTSNGDFVCTAPSGTVEIITLRPATDGVGCIKYTESASATGAPTFLQGTLGGSGTTCT